MSDYGHCSNAPWTYNAYCPENKCSILINSRRMCSLTQHKGINNTNQYTVSRKTPRNEVERV